jgi:carbon-monoxide dehydrogenase large subunit
VTRSSRNRAASRVEEIPAEPPTWTGRPLRRVEDPAILRGWGNFVGDIAARDGSCLYAAFVRSPVAAGRLRSVTAPPGVRLVTAADLTEVRPISPALLRPDYVRVETPILATDVVRFVGEPVAVVLAPTAALAEDALDTVVVDIEATEPVLDADSAVAEGSPLVHDVPFPNDPNTAVDARLTTPGFDAALAAAYTVVHLEVSCGRQSAMPLEARASHVAVDPATGRVTLHTATQMPHVVRTGICDSLGISEDELRVVAPDVGGGFGAKMALAREDIALVHLARRLRQGIAWIETREENFLASWHSREQRYRLAAGYTEDGVLTALQADIVADVGAYSCHPVTFGVEPLMAFAELPGPYTVAEYSVRARAVLSNKCPIAPYRGVSRPVQTLALERLMDVAGRRLGLDPVTIRQRNLVSTFPHTTPTGLVLDQSSHQEALAEAAQRIDLTAFRARQAAAREQGRWLGIGFSCFAERTGYGTPAFAARSMAITPGYERVTMAMDPSGNVVLRIGASPHGQGLRTSLAQVVADELGLRPEQIRIVHGDTDATPYGWGSFGSRSMVIAGGASALAGRALRDRLVEIAADRLECDPDDVELTDGRAQVRGTTVGVSVPELARLAHHSAHLLPGGLPSLEVTASYDPAGTFSNACHVAEVEVDELTGAVEITRFLVVEDAGLLVNPAIVDGQVHGGVVQGIANALFEELLYDDRGVLVTTSLMDYLPPTLAETPDIEIVHLSSVSDATLTGAKGVGEGGAIGAPAAVLNAISDALSPFGIELTHVPATPSRVRTAIRAAQAAPVSEGATR